MATNKRVNKILVNLNFNTNFLISLLTIIIHIDKPKPVVGPVYLYSGYFANTFFEEGYID